MIKVNTKSSKSWRWYVSLTGWEKNSNLALWPPSPKHYLSNNEKKHQTDPS